MIMKNTFPSYSDVYSQLQQVSVHNVNGGEELLELNSLKNQRVKKSPKMENT